MACVLRLSGEKGPIDRFLDAASLWDSIVPRARPSATNWVVVSVSSAKIGDFATQVSDALAFLARHEPHIVRLAQEASVTERMLDFAVEWKSEMATQTERLPAELIRMAAVGGLAIELSHYAVAEDSS